MRGNKRKRREKKFSGTCESTCECESTCDRIQRWKKKKKKKKKNLEGSVCSIEVMKIKNLSLTARNFGKSLQGPSSETEIKRKNNSQ